MHRAFGAPRHTRSQPRQSGPSDQPADLTNHSHTIVSSKIQRFTSFSGTGTPYTRPHRSKSQSISLLSPATLSLSPPISHLQPYQASKPPQKGRPPPTKKNLGIVQCFRRHIWPDKGRERCRPPKLQVVDSPSSAINGRRDHHHRNPRPQMYQNRPSVGQKARRKISPPPTVTAREPHAPPVAFS